MMLSCSFGDSIENSDVAVLINFSFVFLTILAAPSPYILKLSL